MIRLSSLLCLTGVLFFSLSCAAKEPKPTSSTRTPSQFDFTPTPYPGSSGPAPVPGQDGSGTPTVVNQFPEAKFLEADILGSQNKVSQGVYCMNNSPNPYHMPITGSDVSIKRIAVQGAITYEIYKNNVFLGSCAQIYVR